DYPRLASISLCTRSLVRPSIPHFVCSNTAISRDPRSREDITMLRSASASEPPAYLWRHECQYSMHGSHDSPQFVCFLVLSECIRKCSRGTNHVSNNMRLANANSKRLGIVDAGVHTGDEDEPVGGRRRKAAVLEVFYTTLRGHFYVLPKRRYGAGRRKGRGWRGR